MHHSRTCRVPDGPSRDFLWQAVQTIISRSLLSMAYLICFRAVLMQLVNSYLIGIYSQSIGVHLKIKKKTETRDEFVGSQILKFDFHPTPSEPILQA
jgi:hypothetical protein